MTVASRGHAVRPPTIAALMLGLAQLGLLGFGGVGPQAFHLFVVHLRWLDTAEFTEQYSLAQALPGANVVNLCAIVGDRWFGPAGAVAAVCAITLPPLAVVLIAAHALAQLTHAPRFIAAEAAIVAASAGLILATVFRVCVAITRRRTAGIAIACVLALSISAHLVSMPVATLVGVAAGAGIYSLGGDRG